MFAARVTFKLIIITLNNLNQHSIQQLPRIYIVFSQGAGWFQCWYWFVPVLRYMSRWDLLSVHVATKANNEFILTRIFIYIYTIFFREVHKTRLRTRKRGLHHRTDISGVEHGRRENELLQTQRWRSMASFTMIFHTLFSSIFFSAIVA